MTILDNFNKTIYLPYENTMKVIDDNLIVKSLSGNADDKDLEDLKQTIATSEEAAEEFLEIKNIWDAAVSPKVADEIDTRDSLEQILEKICMRTEPEQNFRSKAARLIVKVAAVLSLPLMLLSIYLYYSGRNSDNNRIIAMHQEIKAMPGSLVHTLLPDSTEIWINGGSCIKYCQKPDSARLIDIEGEAFFKVAKDAEHPFRVRTASGLDVEALGTEFNVCSYATDTLTTITLSEGSVRVNDNLSESIMQPGQTIVYNSKKKKGTLYLGNIEKTISWRDGNLAFNNEMLKNVYKRIGQIFDVTFEVDTKLENVILYATFENASLDQILSLIKKSTPLSYEIVEESDKGSVTKRIKVKST